jgi:streptogramin lyase
MRAVVSRSRLCAGVTVGVLGVGLAGLTPASASAAPLGLVTEFSQGITDHSEPYAIVAGPDGNLWFTSPRSDRIGRITPRGAVTEFTAGLTQYAHPLGMTLGPDGSFWFTEARENQIGRITPAGVITEFPAGGTDARAYDIAAGPDGNLWFVKSKTIGRISLSGETAEFPTGLSSPSSVGSITAGPDGNLWFTDYYDRIGRITTSGVTTLFTQGITPGSGLGDIVAGPDGNLWFTEPDGHRIGRITPAGVVTEFTGPTSSPLHLGTGPDGNLWFTLDADGIGRITPSGVVRTFSAGITEGAAPMGIVAGPDRNMWFTELGKHRIGRIGTDASRPAAVPPSMTCRTRGGVAEPRLKVVCHVVGMRPTALVRWKVTRKVDGHLVARGRKSLVAGTLVVNLKAVDDIRRGRHRVTLTKGSGLTKVVLSRVVRVR